MNVDTNGKYILDVCCGGRMFYYDKQNPHVLFMDIRETTEILCDGRTYTVKPDIVADFRNIPFPDKSFSMVIFDPPHLKTIGDKSWLARKYGKLDKNTWQEDIGRGFRECFRVLKPHGFLNFKWNEEEIDADDVISLSPYKPLFGNKTDKTKTIWFTFVKQPELLKDGEQLPLFDIYEDLNIR